jgi:dTMP kinase
VLSSEEVSRISRWATESLTPHLTIILDQSPEIGLARIPDGDRLESESIDFHERIRDEYAILAGADPERYLVLDATNGIDEIALQIKERMAPLLKTRSIIPGN